MKLPQQELKKIAIFRALQLGDLLCSIPAIRAIRRAYPEAHISLIGLPGGQMIVDRFPGYFDEFIAFPGYPGLPEQGFDPEQFELFLTSIRAENFDLILQMQGNGSIVNHLIKAFGSRYVAGFCEHKEQENDLFLEYPNYGHEVNRHLALAAHLGIPSCGTELEFPLSSADELQFEQLNLNIIPKKYICLHPGSRGSWRQWPPLYFAAIADICADKGYEVVLTGTREEMELSQHVADLMKSRPIMCTGRTTLGAIGILISKSFALIANCTGVSHIAAALRIPSLIISMDGEPERWAPLDQHLHQVVDWTSTPEYQIAVKKLKNLFS